MELLPFLANTITFSSGDAFERLEPITDFRQCHGVSPPERRVLYRCRRLRASSDPASDPKHQSSEDDDYILKVKVQIPEITDHSEEKPSLSVNQQQQQQQQQQQSSDASRNELRALEIFRDAGCEASPRLAAFETFRQGPDGLLPGGYISCMVMSRLQGRSLFELGYWSLEPDDRAEIQQRFLEALAAVRKLGVEPGDKGLRNVMWDRENKTCGLVDFEMWHTFAGDAGDSAEERTEELQEWGLAHRPPAKNWWAEFGIKTC